MSLKTSFATVSKCLGLGLLTAMGPSAAPAAPDLATHAGAPPATGMELIAFEAPGCIYCPVFRRDVAPSYPSTRAGKWAPLRFVDINDVAVDNLALNSPVTVVPTLVLMRDGMEIGRIAGYVGRENMHQMLNAYLPSD